MAKVKRDELLAFAFEDWFDTFERDGGELLLYNTVDLYDAFLAGARYGKEQSCSQPMQ